MKQQWELDEEIPLEEVQTPDPAKYDKFKRHFNKKDFDKRVENPKLIRRADAMLNDQDVDVIPMKNLFMELYL